MADRDRTLAQPGIVDADRRQRGVHRPLRLRLRPPTPLDAIDAWLGAQREDQRPSVQSWFARMRRCGDDVRELMHDGCPTACVGAAVFGYVNAFKDHVNVGFFLDALLDEPARLPEGTGTRGRHVKLRPASEVGADALAKLIETAYADIQARQGK